MGPLVLKAASASSTEDDGVQILTAEEKPLGGSSERSANKYGKAMQNVNVAGVTLFIQILGGRRHLAVGL